MTSRARLPEDAAPSPMPDCTYEIYLATWKAARLAAKAKDAARMAALRARAEARTGGARTAALLALADVEADVSKRSKVEVCRPHCTSRCERGV